MSITINAVPAHGGSRVSSVVLELITRAVASPPHGLSGAPASLAPGCRLLGLRSALGARRATCATSGAFSASARGALSVGDLRRPFLAHALLAKALVLLVVVHA